MKSIRKSNLFTTAVVMLFFFSIIGFWGCEEESEFESQYTEYLDLETYEMSKMEVKDMEILGQALQRLNIYKKKGRYEISQTSGAQVNISEDLFDYITKGFEHTNVVYNSKSFSSIIPRLKSGGYEGSNGQPIDSTHCASYALAGMGGVNYATAAAYSDNRYGTNGVPADSMASFFYHFYPNGSSVNPNSLSGGSMGSNMIYFRTSDNIGHAVNGIYYDAKTGNLMYYDPQNGNTGVINISDVVGVFRP